MNYKVMSHNYQNTGGHIMVSIFEVWLPDENRTVFVNVGEGCSTLTTVNHILNDVEIDDYDAITIDNANYRDGDASSKYFELHQHCLFEHLKADCEAMNYEECLAFDWLPKRVQLLMTEEERMYVEDELDGTFRTNGHVVKILKADGEVREINAVRKAQTVHQTLAAALTVCRDKLMIDNEFMDIDDRDKLMVTIEDIEYWLTQTN